jgi:hypothetical protein
MVWTEPEWQLAREPDVLSLLIIVIVGLDIAVVFKGDLRLDATAGASFWESERHGHGGLARMGVLGVCCWLLQCHQLGCVAVSLTVALNTALTSHMAYGVGAEGWGIPGWWALHGHRDSGLSHALGLPKPAPCRADGRVAFRTNHCMLCLLIRVIPSDWTPEWNLGLSPQI